MTLYLFEYTKLKVLMEFEPNIIPNILLHFNGIEP